MENDVTNPPVLVAQETGAWCFAAAEVMVRAYRNLPPMSQYAIARRSTVSLAALDPAVGERWELAQALDASVDPPQQENGGANLNSEVVQVVRTQWNAFDDAATGGHFPATDLTADMVRGEIDADRIFVIGTAIHYYVVYGYANDGNVMKLRDPWPVGTGGFTTTMTLQHFLALQGHVTIFF